jgi:two-component system, chemotaxis family, CheB/CheR fusion protein
MKKTRRVTRPAPPRSKGPRKAAPGSGATGGTSTSTENGTTAGSSAPPFLVAAVGASAGGLEAFTALIRSISRDAALALLLVQHLSRDEKSHLVELLGHATALTVVQGQHGMRIEPGHVYVISPNTRMTVIDGHLVVRPRATDPGNDAPVDLLFRSVAEQYRERSIGVVLSGSAHDGAAGLRDIKGAGGITFVQNPEEATIDGMPRAAIATGAVDAVLPVKAISEELVRLSHHPFFQGQGDASAGEQPADDGHLRRVFQLLRRQSGVDFSQYKLPTISRRIHRRIALNRLGTLGDYASYLQQSPREVDSLHEDLLIHVTSFFREPESFEALKETVLPRLLATHGGEPIRAWVPGCSTGEEAYSLAITLLEFLADKGEHVPMQIFGTDVSEQTVERARSGEYPRSIASDVSAARLTSYFVSLEGGYRIGKTVRERCIFARQDITRDPPFSKLDLIVCRNVLIYLAPAVQRRVISVFHYALKPTGYLMLGRSETIGPLADLFAAADRRFKIYSRKRASPRLEVDFRTPPAMTATLSAALPRPTGGLLDVRESDLHGEVNRLLVDRYSPPGVIVDKDSRIVRSRGRTGPYLELQTGEASLDILKMVRPALVSGLRSAIEQARTRGTSARREGLRLRSEGEARVVDLEVTPIAAADGRHLLVLFEEPPRPAPGPSRAAAPRAGKGRKSGDRVVEQLEDDLATTREHLQAIIHDFAAANEELQSANEEILSSNEELQSTNEELDTAKEELQSTNEELSTLNDELEGRNEEMTEVNSDLLNLLASVQIPIVIVTTDLKIRRFTPAARKTLNLIASDVGRSIGHIKPNILCPDLEALITRVIETVDPLDREVEDHEGRLFALRIRPYKNLENKIDGAVLTLFDITSTRDAEAELAVAQATGEAIIATVREPILLLTSDLQVRRANRAFCEKFAVTPGETEGKYVYDLGGRAWDIPRLRQLLEEILPEKKNFEGFLVEHEFAQIGRKKMCVDGRRIESGRAAGGVILLIVRDVTGDAR